MHYLALKLHFASLIWSTCNGPILEREAFTLSNSMDDPVKLRSHSQDNQSFQPIETQEQL